MVFPGDKAAPAAAVGATTGTGGMAPAAHLARRAARFTAVAGDNSAVGGDCAAATVDVTAGTSTSFVYHVYVVFKITSTSF